MAEPDLSAERTSLGELARLFLRLGATTFGGPAAHIAMMREHVVRRRGWLTDAAFLDLVSATNLIPGPNSTELAIHIGYQRRRWAGLLIAGVAFIAPAMLLTGALAWAYVRYDTVPAVGWFLYGVKPVILAVILQAIAGLAPRAAGTTGLRVLGGAAVLALALGAPELAVLFGAGLAAIIAHRARAPRRPDERVAPSMFAPLLPAAATTTAAASLPSIFGVFAKIGSVLFGSGYVLVAFLRAELVQQRGWLTEGQLVDAVAVGQVTPGPVFTTATFIGYLLAGPSGALVATAGIFLPAFVFVAASGPLVPRLRASPTAGAFLDGVNVASLALMAAVTVRLGAATLIDGPTIALALLGAALLIRYKLDATWLIVIGAAAGWGVHTLGWAG